MIGIARSLNHLLFRSIENPSVPLSSDDDRLYEWTGADRSDSGMRVSRDSALRYSPVWRAINLISRDTAKCKLNIWKESPDGKRLLAKKHPSWKFLRRKPNSFQTAFVWKQMMKFHELFYGNSYSYIKRNLQGDVLELIPLYPDVTEAILVQGNLFYTTQIDGKQHTLYPENVLHFKALSFNGVEGYGILRMAKDSIGLGKAQQKFSSVFFRNNAQPSGVLSHPATLSDEAFKRLKESWTHTNGGLDNAHKPKILEEGMKWLQMGINAKDAQLIEGKKYELIEVANWFSIPPHKLGDSSRLSYNSLEQENQSYIDDSLDPGFVNWEEECEDKLLTEREKENESHEVEFDRKSLVRANLKDRAEKNRISLGGNPWRSVNEVRKEEGLDPIDEEWADEVPRPKNMSTGDNPAAAPDDPPADPPPAAAKDGNPDGEDDGGSKKKADQTDEGDQKDRSREQMLSALRGVTLDVARRMVKRLCVQARRSSKAPSGFNAWLDRMREENSATISEAFAPLKRLCEASGARLGDIETNISGEIRAELLEVSGRLKRAEFEVGVSAVCDRLEETLPARLVELVNVI